MSSPPGVRARTGRLARHLALLPLLLTPSLLGACAHGERPPGPSASQASTPAPAAERTAAHPEQAHVPEAPSPGPDCGHAHHRFDDAEAWAKRFEDPARDAWQKPDEVIAALRLAPAAKVADLGAGTGYFAVRLARALPRGTVHAVDVEASMVDYLRARARREGLTNLQVHQALADDARLPEPVDLVLVVNTYHHLQQRTAYFQRLAQRLTASGRLAIVDFKRGSPRGPPDAEKLPPERVEAELRAAGFTLERSEGFLPDQYLLVFGRTRR